MFIHDRLGRRKDATGAIVDLIRVASSSGMGSTHLIGHELGHNLMSIARDAGVITEAQQKELDALFTDKNGKFDEEAFAEAFARELKRSFFETVQKRMEDVPTTKAGRALRRVADFIATLAKSFAFWRQERGLDPVTGQPLQAGQVLDAFLKRERTAVDEATQVANAARAAETRATQEAMANAPTQTVVDEDGTEVAYHERGQVSTEEDSAYLDAVRNGDLDTARRMVVEAARQAGYDVEAFHGTGRFGFTVFNPRRLKNGDLRPEDERTIFLGNLALASSYSGEVEPRELGKPVPKISLAKMMKDDASFLKEVRRIAKLVGADVKIKKWYERDFHDYSEIDFKEDIESEIQYAIIEKAWADSSPLQFWIKTPSLARGDLRYDGKRTEEDFKAYMEGQKADFTKWLNGFNGGTGTYALGVRMENPLIIDAEGAQWLWLPLPEGGRGNTHTLAKWALEHGYDGVVINNVRDQGEYNGSGPYNSPQTEYIVFDSEQVKSLDPVTYDDNGKIIPLSERFNPENLDIRWHISDRDRNTWNEGVRDYLEHAAKMDGDMYWRLEPKQMFSEAPDILKFLSRTGVLSKIFGDMFDETLPIKVDIGVMDKIHQGTDARRIGAAHTHDLTDDDLYHLIDAIADPLAIAVSAIRPNDSIVFFTEMLERTERNGNEYYNPVIVPLCIKARGPYNDRHYEITSAYGLSNRNTWNEIIDQLSSYPDELLYVNRGKLSRHESPQFSRRGQRTYVAHKELGLRRLADTLQDIMSHSRNRVPDEWGYKKIAPELHKPSSPSIIDQPASETQGENKSDPNEERRDHIHVWSGAPQAYDHPDILFIGSGTGGQNEGYGLYASGVLGVARDKYARSYIPKNPKTWAQLPVNGDRRYKTLGEFGKRSKTWAMKGAINPEENIKIFFAALANDAVSGKIPKGNVKEALKKAILAELEREGKAAEEYNAWRGAIFNGGQVEPKTRRQERAEARAAQLYEMYLALGFNQESVLDEQINALLDVPVNQPAVMEQTWFTNRPEGDVSHLLSWFEPVTDEQRKWVEAAYDKRFADFDGYNYWKERIFKPGIIGKDFYKELHDLFLNIAHRSGMPTTDWVVQGHLVKFLLDADIDGTRYPVDYRHGHMKGELGWNYVAFSDEHLRVDHVYEYNPETDGFELKWHESEGGASLRFTETPLGQELVAKAFDAIVGSRVDLLLRPSRYYGNPYETRDRNPRNALVTEHLNRDVDVSEPKGFAAEVSAEISRFGTREGDPTLREILARCGSKARFYEVLGAVYETAEAIRSGLSEVVTGRERAMMENAGLQAAEFIKHNATARATALGRKLYLMGREFAWKLYKEDIAAARAEAQAKVREAKAQTREAKAQTRNAERREETARNQAYQNRWGLAEERFMREYERALLRHQAARKVSDVREKMQEQVDLLRLREAKKRALERERGVTFTALKATLGVDIPARLRALAGTQEDPFEAAAKLIAEIDDGFDKWVKRDRRDLLDGTESYTYLNEQGERAYAETMGNVLKAVARDLSYGKLREALVNAADKIARAKHDTVRVIVEGKLGRVARVLRLAQNADIVTLANRRIKSALAEANKRLSSANSGMRTRYMTAMRKQAKELIKTMQLAVSAQDNTKASEKKRYAMLAERARLAEELKVIESGKTPDDLAKDETLTDRQHQDAVKLMFLEKFGDLSYTIDPAEVWAKAAEGKPLLYLDTKRAACFRSSRPQ